MKKSDSPAKLNFPQSLEPLKDLAYDLSSTWDRESRELWADLNALGTKKDPNLEIFNPVQTLSRLNSKAVESLANDSKFLKRVQSIRRRLNRERAASRARGKATGQPFTEKRPVAYFSMEFAVHTCLPFYAGGLGVLAGDHLKSASDIGLPLIGIGLAYRQGYFRQQIDADGEMKVIYPKVNYGNLPLELVRDQRGKPITVDVNLAGKTPRPVKLRIWRVQTGNSSIILLDSDFDANPARERALTRHLYGGTREDRIQQEILAGIGGVRAMRAMGLNPPVWHLNEGHVTFSTLERLRELKVEEEKKGKLFDPQTAIEKIAASTVFTTHTPVPEGNEVFDLALARRYLEPICQAAGIGVDDYLRLGLDLSPEGTPILSMTVLAMRLSRHRNGVSKLHGVVSRGMWQHLWPDFLPEEVPITSVTNGVHVPTWISQEMSKLYDQHLGAEWRQRLEDPNFWKKTSKIPDRDLWDVKTQLRQRMVEFVRTRVAEQMKRNGDSPAKIKNATENLLDPNVLTIGFARRFALYKRASLFFRDVKKAKALLNNSRKPVQMVFAGKPHPEDPLGKKLYEEVVAISKKPGFKGKVVILENYDMDIGQALVQGVDIWLNNPRRPLEASGTSGQKVPFNGGINVSILDGWWDEGYEPDAGWAFGKPGEYEDLDLQDADDARAMLQVFSKEVIPLFYQNNKKGLPAAWLKKLKKSMSLLIPVFNTDHMVAQYRDRLYKPAFELARRIEKNKNAEKLSKFKDEVLTAWPMVHIKNQERSKKRGQELIAVEVFTAGLSAAEIGAVLETQSGELLDPKKVSTSADCLVQFEFSPPKKGAESVQVRFWPQGEDLGHPHEMGYCLETIV